MKEYYSRKYNKSIIIGETYNKIKILEIYKKYRNNGYHRVKVKYECICGNFGDTAMDDIIKEHTKSCGCLRAELTSIRFKNHGLSKKWWYSSLAHMMNRCYNVNDDSYKYYGERGITVCRDWNTIEIDTKQAFENFGKWAEDNNFIPGYTIERIDVNKNYCPENCTFIPRPDQGNNKTSSRIFSLNGETKCLMQWSKDKVCKVSYKVLLWRVDNNWDFEKAMITPTRIRRKK